jgi:hypothetical protein
MKFNVVPYVFSLTPLPAWSTTKSKRSTPTKCPALQGPMELGFRVYDLEFRP